MKIAHIVSSAENVPPQSKNGLEFIAHWLTDELIKRGHEITLFAPAGSLTKANLKSLIAQGVTVQNIPDFEKAIIPISIWNSIFASSQADNFDLIHCHNDAAYVTAFTDVPVLQTIHHPYAQDFLVPYIERKENIPYLDFIFEQYKKINYITISNNQQSQFKEGAGDYYFKKYKTIYNGIPVDQFSFNAHPQDYLLFIGFINKNKGADIAVQVARKLKKKLILAGNYTGQEAFFDEHIKPYLNDDIQYVGPVDFEKKNELYKNAVATLAPLHWHEPFGLTLVESQACGTPVIAFNKGAASEIINHGETGFVVETLDEMCEAVQKIGTIKRENCRSWVEQKFSVEKMVDAYENYYKELLAKKV